MFVYNCDEVSNSEDGNTSLGSTFSSDLHVAETLSFERSNLVMYRSRSYSRVWVQRSERAANLPGA